MSILIIFGVTFASTIALIVCSVSSPNYTTSPAFKRFGAAMLALSLGGSMLSLVLLIQTASSLNSFLGG